MIEAALVFVRWLLARVRSRAAVALSIRDTYIIFCAMYCTLASLLLGAVFFAIERRAGMEKPFIDCLFHVASAATSTGLITLDTSTLQTGSNAVIFVVMFFCANTLLLTQVPVILRICRVRAARAAAAKRSSALEAARAVLSAPPHALPPSALIAVPQNPAAAKLDLVEVADESGAMRTLRLSRQPARAKLSTMFGGDVKSPKADAPPGLSRTISSGGGAALDVAGASTATLKELAQYHADLESHERRTRALESFLEGPEFLGYHFSVGLALAYYVTIVFAGFVAFWSWGAAVSGSSMDILTRNGVSSIPWFSAYHSLALFTTSGMMMITDNMVQFGRDKFFVVTSGVIASLGFSFYPLGFRVFVIVAHAAIPSSWSASKAAVRDILDHPRKYTSHLFSPRGTLVLALMSFLTQSALFIVHLIFELKATYFISLFPAISDSVMNGWFSSVMVYNAGFNTFDLSYLNQGSIIFMMMCMWLTGRPFYLGIAMTAVDDGLSEDRHAISQKAPPSAWKRVLADFIEMLRTDMCVGVICAMLICFVDSDLIVSSINGPTPSVGSQSYIGIVPIMFDLSSAYGNVGLSLGYPGTVTSSCAVLSPFSKLVVIFMCTHGYCMGIYPSSLVNLELPAGVDGSDVAAQGSSQKEASRLEESFEIVKRLPLSALLEFNEHAATTAHTVFNNGALDEHDDVTYRDLATLDEILGSLSAPTAVMLSRLTSHTLHKRFLEKQGGGAAAVTLIPARSGGRGGM